MISKDTRLGWSNRKMKNCALAPPSPRMLIAQHRHKQDWVANWAVFQLLLKRQTSVETRCLGFHECSQPRRVLLKSVGSLLISRKIGNPTYRSQHITGKNLLSPKLPV